ncbi:unnamed protein product [Discosporangium mesarthrocarpum]
MMGHKVEGETREAGGNRNEDELVPSARVHAGDWAGEEVGGLEIAGAAGATALAIFTLTTVGFPGEALAAAPGWVGPTKLILDPILLFFEAAFIARIILSWYPAVSDVGRN